MDMLGPVWVKQSAGDVSHHCFERIGRRVGTLRRLRDVVLQDGVNLPLYLQPLVFYFTLSRALKTDGTSCSYKMVSALQ